MSRFLFLLTIILFYGAAANAQADAMRARAHTIVYKTKADYNNKVPVVIAPGGKTIASYPDPVDIRARADGFLPLRLHKGYLLSRYGVGKNTAFLKLTLKQYAALKTTPSPADVYNMILARNPLTELYDCGVTVSPDSVQKNLNKIIDRRLLRKQCKQLYPKAR